MNKKKLLAKIKNNSENVRFNDFVTLINAFNFEIIRSKGSHFIYERKDVPEMLNIQNKKGKAKSYQVEQFLELIEKYNLELEDK